MRALSSYSLPVLLVSAVLLLVACDSVEERAEKRYQSGLALIESGDLDRAIVELRSVFDLAPNHLEARQKLADLLLTHRGNQQAAYRQYLRIAEQYPDDFETRIILTELAFASTNWDEFQRHGDRALELAPDDPRVQAIDAVTSYRAAALEQENAARREHAQTVQLLLEEQPENRMLRSVLIDNHLRENELSDAIAGIDWILERDPDNRQVLRQRLSILAQLQDFEAVETQLKEMVDLFPEDDSQKTTLIRFYLSRGEMDKAEGFLRELAAASSEIGPRVDLIRFTGQLRGLDAAREEVAAALKDHPGDVRLRIVSAGLDFRAGLQDEAIAELEAVLEESPDSEFKDEAFVALAQMLLQNDNEVGARARVEEALVANPSSAEALKMKARWLIQSDETDEAVAALRTALDSSPDDANAMTLMAEAHARAGRQDLARDFLALAVDASGNAPAETIRYARVLINEERYLPAEDILLPALRLAPNNADLLIILGQLYLGMDDMGRVEQVAATLRRLDNDATREAANQLDAERINRQAGSEEALSYLSSIASSADATLASKIFLIRANVGTRNYEDALEQARELLAENPENLAVKSVVASVETISGNLDEAEKLYEEILKEAPGEGRIWLQLSQLKGRKGDMEGASLALKQGLEAAPQNINLLWAQASLAERNGDIEEAIKIYESVYTTNSNSVLIANNLASLLTTYRTDEESLDRAWNISRRLRDTEVPAMQDTYGWITHRRGDSEDALPYLEAAVAGLPQDALVHYHLAEVYLALGRTEDALATYRQSVSIAGSIDTRVQITDAKAKIVELERVIAEAGDTDNETATSGD